MQSRWIRFVLFVMLTVGVWGVAQGAAHAAPMQQALAVPTKPSFLPVAAEIGQQLQELVTGDPNAEIEPQETFGTRALNLILNSAKIVGGETGKFVSNFAALPQLSTWLTQQISDPFAQEKWIQIFLLTFQVVAIGLMAGWAADLLLLPLRRRIYRREYLSLGAKFGGIFSWFLLSLIPVTLFIVAALVIVDVMAPAKLVKFVALTVVYALALVRLVRLFMRFLFSPKSEALRLVPVSTPQASYIINWVSWFAGLMVAGYFITDLAKLLKVPATAISAFGSLIAFVIVMMTIVIIAQKRAFVSTFIRGDLSAAQKRLTLWQSLRLWFARSWHALAISYLVIGYFVTMLGAGGGFDLMQQGTVGTLLVLLAMRFGFYGVWRLTAKRSHEELGYSSGIFIPVVRLMMKAAIWGLGIAGILGSWGFDVHGLLSSPWGQRVVGSVFSIGSTLFIVVAVYEIIHATIERRLNKRDSDGNIIEANGRARTLLPMLRNAAIIILAVIVGLVTLAELGINIAPLLAGAGVLGVAVGFGSQTLVKDFLTGLFIILEDVIAVGDAVVIASHKGTVEGITIRTIRLRDMHGALHILPFSEISQIVNESKGFSFALMDIGVDYSSDLNKVMAVMNRVGESLRQDENFRDLILEPMEVMGVESLGDSSIVVRGRIKTVGGRQADVRRAYLLRLKQAFDEEKIEIPYPHVVYVRKDVEGT